MKVIVTEYISSKGHRNLFLNICKMLQLGGIEVVAVVPNNYEDKILFCKTINHRLNYYNDIYKHSSINMIKYSLRVQCTVNKIAKKEGADAILVVSFDELSIALGKFIMPCVKPQIVIQNSNIDRIEESRVRRIAFNFFKNSVFHIVLAGFIKKYMVEKLSISEDLVSVLPHPMVQLENVTERDIDLVGLSSGNDEDIVSRLVDMEKKEGIFSKNNLRVVLKSRQQTYDDGFLSIVKGYIPDEEYTDLILRAKCIYAPYPLTYRNRMSAILVDAMANNKPVIGSPIPVIINASYHYVNSVRLFNIDTIVRDIRELGTSSDAQVEEFKEFQSYREEDSLAKQLTESVTNFVLGASIKDNYDF